MLKSFETFVSIFGMEGHSEGGNTTVDIKVVEVRSD